jgi:bifunctional DNA-binding transcriptional regulator/antitoxin component of YhaV-PrlF toxin-antitoxin module
MDAKAKKAVIVVGRRDTKGYVTYAVTIPKEFARELGIDSGDILFAEVMEIEVGGSKRKAIVYYKP